MDKMDTFFWVHTTATIESQLKPRSFFPEREKRLLEAQGSFSRCRLSWRRSCVVPALNELVTRLLDVYWYLPYEEVLPRFLAVKREVDNCMSECLAVCVLVSLSFFL